MVTTQMTVTQIYDGEFGGSTGRDANAFAHAAAKITAQKLGAPADEDKKKVQRPKTGDVNIPQLGTLTSPTLALRVTSRTMNIPTPARLVSHEHPHVGDVATSPHGDVQIYVKYDV